MRRREFLVTVAAAGSLGVSVSGRAAAEGPYSEQPPHVTLDGYSDVPNKLERYQPRLVTRTLEIDPDALYCWRATSDEYNNTAWYCYWMWYSAGQDGVSDADTHVPDREPVYVAVDETTGDIKRVIFDRYHYFVGETVPTSDRPRLHVINPWHNLRETTEEGTLDITLRDMHDRYTEWVNLGWSVDRRSVVDPAHVESRGHWWPPNPLGFSGTATVTQTVLALRDMGINVGLPVRIT